MLFFCGFFFFFLGGGGFLCPLTSHLRDPPNQKAYQTRSRVNVRQRNSEFNVDRRLDYSLDPGDFPPMERPTGPQHYCPQGNGKGKRPPPKGQQPQGSNIKRSRSSSPVASTLTDRQDFAPPPPPGTPGPESPGRTWGLANCRTEAQKCPTTKSPSNQSPETNLSWDPGEFPKGSHGPHERPQVDPNILVKNNWAVATTVNVSQFHSSNHITFVPIYNVNNNNNHDLLLDFTNKICTPASVINLSDYTLSRDELSLLERGLNFCPTPGEPHAGDLRRDLDNFHRRLKIKTFFDPSLNSSTNWKTWAHSPRVVSWALWM